MSDIIMTTIITGMRNFIEKHIGGTLLSCRLDCAIKNGTASCGYKNQPLSARQTKKSPWQYSLEAFQDILSRIFLAVP